MTSSWIARHWPGPLSIVTLWLAFAGVHYVLILVNLYSLSNPMGDVFQVYRGWVDQAQLGQVPGIDTTFVYPLPSLLPMLVADAVGGQANYGLGWLLVVAAGNAVAFAALTLWRPSSRDARLRQIAAWWWLVLMALLGPVALGRIDAVSVPIAIIALLALRRRPEIAGALLTFGAWLKIWPAAVFAAAFIVLRHRLWLVAGAVVVCAAVLIPALALGGGSNVFSFVTEQTGRGLQVEAVAATVPMWLASMQVPGYDAYYSMEILTFQVDGPGTEFVSALLTPVLGLAVLGVVLLALVSKRRGMPFTRLFPALSLALVLSFIVFNKVGSPQFITWLAPVIVFGLIVDIRRFALPAGIALCIAWLTQIIYPGNYNFVTDAHSAGVALLAGRNGLLVVLLVWALWAMWPRRRRAVRGVPSDSSGARTSASSAVREHGADGVADVVDLEQEPVVAEVRPDRDGPVA